MGLLSFGSATDADEQARYDGESLFSGMFLGHGPVAEEHPHLQLSQASVQDPQQARALIERIRQLVPGFFPTFEADITSGDRIRIDTAAASAGHLVRSATGPGNDGHSPAGAFIFVDRTIVKATNVVMNQNKYWVPPESHAVTALGRERWVNDVAETLTR